MTKQDVEELHNAFLGLNEQVLYIKWLCEQLGYIDDSEKPLDGSYKHIPDAERISQDSMSFGKTK